MQARRSVKQPAAFCAPSLRSITLFMTRRTRIALSFLSLSLASLATSSSEFCNLRARDEDIDRVLLLSAEVSRHPNPSMMSRDPFTFHFLSQCGLVPASLFSRHRLGQPFASCCLHPFPWRQPSRETTAEVGNSWPSSLPLRQTVASLLPLAGLHSGGARIGVLCGG